MSVYGSHHIQLANFTAHLWNSIIEQTPSTNLKPLPTLPAIQMKEAFGVINSAHVATYGGLFELKQEDDNDIINLFDFDDDLAFSHDLGIDPAQLSHSKVTNSKVMDPKVGKESTRPGARKRSPGTGDCCLE